MADTKIYSIESLEPEWFGLLTQAREAQAKAYAPYSRFLVGSAVEDEAGKVHSGCNVENASYSAAICAERTAVVKMVSSGVRRLKRVVVVASASEPCFPCGVCLQVLNEFGGPEVQVVAVDGEASRFRRLALCELLPHSFGPERLIGETR
jgi:cytidine deaminase